MRGKQPQEKPVKVTEDMHLANRNLPDLTCFVTESMSLTKRSCSVLTPAGKATGWAKSQTLAKGFFSHPLTPIPVPLELSLACHRN